MKTLIVTFLLSAFVAIIVTPLVRRFAPKIGSVDLPSGRRVNKKVIPRLGGIAILLGFLAPLAGLMMYDNRVSAAFQSDLYRILALLGGSIAISIVGALDDIKGARALYKLGIQVLIAVGAYLGGFQIKLITLPFIGAFEMGIFALPITILWIVGIINAVNLIDGLDGLAAGVAFFVCVVNFTIGLTSNSILMALISVALGGALIGFLVFNFNPATIFMGDTGSMLIGYVLATTALIGSKGGTAVALLIPILAMGVPIFDTLLAIIRRYLTNQPIFSADKGHIHHRLLEMGLTHKKTVLVLYAVSLLFTAAAIAVYMNREDWSAGVILLAASLLVFVMMRVVGIFQLKKLKESMIASNEDDTLLAAKKALPEFIIKTSNITSIETLEVALNEFCKQTEMIMAKASCDDSHPLSGWVWESSEGLSLIGRNYITSRCQTESGDEENPLAITFGWSSSDAKVSPQLSIIFTLLIESIQKSVSLLKH